MGNKSQTTRRSRGFTMLEFTITVLIGLILAVISGAAYFIYQRDLPVKYAAGRLNQCLSTARAYAIANNSIYTVQLDPHYLNYWIDETDDLGQVTVPKVTTPEKLGDKVDLAAVMMDGVAVPTNLNTISIRFFADGSCDDTSLTLATGQGAQALYYTVRIYGPSGLGRVFHSTTTTTTSGTLAAAAKPAPPAGRQATQ